MAVIDEYVREWAAYRSVERKLIRHVLKGDRVNLSEEREPVRGDVIAKLVQGLVYNGKTHPKGISLEGATIEGTILLNGARRTSPGSVAPCLPLALRKCTFVMENGKTEEDFDDSVYHGVYMGLLLRHGLFSRVSLIECTLDKINAVGSEMTDEVNFARCTLQSIDLSGSRVNGSLILEKISGFDVTTCEINSCSSASQNEKNNKSEIQVNKINDIRKFLYNKNYSFPNNSINFYEYQKNKSKVKKYKLDRFHFCQIVCNESVIRGRISIDQSLLKTCSIANTDVTGGFSMSHGCYIDGLILNGSRIRGNIDCIGSIILNKKGTSVDLDQVNVGGGIHVRPFPRSQDEDQNDGICLIDGRISIVSAQVGDDIDFSGATIHCPRDGERKGIALNARNIDVGGSAFFRAVGYHPFLSIGLLSLEGARIVSDLECGGGWFVQPRTDDFDVNKAYDTKSYPRGDRAIDIDSARIGGSVRFGYQSLPFRESAEADSPQPSGDPPQNTHPHQERVRFPSIVFGCFSLDSAKIEGRLRLSDGIFIVDPKYYCVIDRRDEVHNARLVRFNKVGVAISALSSQINSALETRRFGSFTNIEFEASKKFFNNWASMPYLNRIYNNTSQLINKDNREFLDYFHSTDEKNFVMVMPNGLFDLRGCHTGALLDHPLFGWPYESGLIELNGMTYDIVEIIPPMETKSHWFDVSNLVKIGSIIVRFMVFMMYLFFPTYLIYIFLKKVFQKSDTVITKIVPRWNKNRRDLRTSIKHRNDPNTSVYLRRQCWLQHQYHGYQPKKNDFKPQPYDHLARSLRYLGFDHDADRVMWNRQTLRRRCRRDSFVYRWISSFLEWTSGYGYSPQRALRSLTLFIYLGCVLAVFWNNFASVDENFVRHLEDRNLSAVKDSVLFSLQHGETECPNQFDPIIYSVRNFLPIIEAFDIPGCIEYATLGFWAKIYLTIDELFGWIISSIAIVTFTGIMRRSN